MVNEDLLRPAWRRGSIWRSVNDVLILHLSSYHESLYYPLQNTSGGATTSDSSSISSFTSTISNTSKKI